MVRKEATKAMNSAMGRSRDTRAGLRAPGQAGAGLALTQLEPPMTTFLLPSVCLLAEREKGVVE